jgi:ubiquinone/menaquinone biosynthesis C-methylase UbiE
MEEEKRINEEKAFWNKLSNKYDQFIKSNWKIYDEELLNKIYENVDNDIVVLDVACGTALISEKISPKVKMVYGIDIAEKMISEGKQKIDEKGIQNIKLSVGDAYNLTFEDNSFDTVVCINALHNMQNPEKALSEIKRVLKYDGKAIFSIVGIGGSIKYTVMMFIYNLFKKTPLPIYWKVDFKQASEFIKNAGFQILLKEKIQLKGDAFPQLYFVVKNHKSNS